MRNSFVIIDRINPTNTVLSLRRLLACGAKCQKIYWQNSSLTYRVFVLYSERE